MNKAGRNLVLAVVPCLGLLMAAARPAFATPEVYGEISWSASLYFFPPPNSDEPISVPGLVISCFGAGVQGGNGNCYSQELTLGQSITSSGSYSASSVGGIEVTNTTDQTIEAAAALSFDPGPYTGMYVAIDNPDTQYASFQWSIAGSADTGGIGYFADGYVGVGAPDGCEVTGDAWDNAGGCPDSVFAVLAGVSTDASYNPAVTIDLAPGASTYLTFTSSLQAQFVLPEPSSLALLASGLFLTAAFLIRSRSLSGT